MQEPLDLSKVKVSLFSQSGALKTSVNCAPNGYYFLPIEEKVWFTNWIFFYNIQ